MVPEDMEYVPEGSRRSAVPVLICMALGLVVGIGVMAYQVSRMKTVVSKNSAADYVRPGSMLLTDSRDIFLYSHVTRTPKPQNNHSGGGHGGGGRGGGGHRGGAGGRI